MQLKKIIFLCLLFLISSNVNATEWSYVLAAQHACANTYSAGCVVVSAGSGTYQIYYKTAPTGYYTRSVYGTDYNCDGGIYSSDSYNPGTYTAYVCDGTYTQNNVTGLYGPTIYQCAQRMECGGGTSITTKSGALGGNQFTAATICPVSAYTLQGSCSIVLTLYLSITNVTTDCSYHCTH